MLKIGDEVTLVNAYEGTREVPGAGPRVNMHYQGLLGTEGIVMDSPHEIGTVRVRFKGRGIEDLFPWRLELVNVSLENK